VNTLTLTNLSKKFSQQWIFRDISIQANEGDAVAITGFNGSGKSTLIQIIAGYISPTNGEVDYLIKGKKSNPGDFYQHISLATPYLELIEEFTLKEMISFYRKFKPFPDNLDTEKIIETTGLGFSSGKPIKYFSSGMKQRVKLTLALMADASCALLDEPLSNLDQNGVNWFAGLINDYKKNKILFISSNRTEEETGICNKFITIEDYKK
jgi:ABC-type multidrug transport system ATPase subunit